MNNKDSSKESLNSTTNEKEETFKILKEQGFTEEIINSAIEQSGSTNIETVLLYIEKIQELENKNKIRLKEREEAIKRNKKENEEKLRIIQEQRENKLRDELYLNKLREQIKCDMEERNLTYINESTKEIKGTVRVSENECRIKVRKMWDGKSLFIYLDKNQTVSKLFELIKERLNEKNLLFYQTLSQSQIFETDETLENSGYFPSATIVVNK
ncbi:hypothetical protein DMUE_0383 [Dictyocoela muelleri]|nr:hypothetical protein DMUE_0383 [Dictyocoela muelleri]